MALGFTNPMAGPILVGKLGWHDLYHMRLWARPLRLRRTGAGGLAPRSGDYLESFDARHAELWRAEGYRNALVRSAEYLTWRYLDAPRDYRVLGDERGFAVVGHAVRKGFSAGVVCELVGPAHRLLRRCVRESKGCDIVLGVPGPGQRAAYLAAGFVPAPGTIRVIGKPLRDGVRDPRPVGLHPRRHRHLLVRKVVFITQQVDPDHPALAATVAKIRAIAARVDEVAVLADGIVPGVLPDNCRLHRFGAGDEGRARRPLRERARAGAAARSPSA